jgi:AcrR family transcriptional regulator
MSNNYKIKVGKRGNKMTGRKNRAEKNRNSIIRSATELFISQGIKKVSVSDVAQKAGVTPATIYNQFGSKDTLVREVIIEWFSRTLDDYKQVLHSKMTFEKKLQEVISFKSDLAGKMHGEFLMAATSDIDPQTKEFFDKEYMVELIRCVNDFYDEGRQQGYIDPELSTETILRYTEIIRRGLQAEAELATDPEYTSELLRELTPIFLYGIMGRQERKENE